MRKTIIVIASCWRITQVICLSMNFDRFVILTFASEDLETPL